MRLAIRCLLAGVTAACAATAPAPVATPAPAVLATPATVPPRTSAPTIAGTPVPAIVSGTALVEAGDAFFSPAQLTVTVGTTVVWRIVGQSAHDVTARDGSFGSSALSFGSTFTHVFTAPGLYPYVCTIHAGDGMFGEVRVVAP